MIIQATYPGSIAGTTAAAAKRKQSTEDLVQFSTKKQRLDHGASRISSRPVALTTPSIFIRPHEDLIDRLNSAYEVKTMSVQSSTKLSKHIDKALQHLGRFSSWDKTVLPGVIFLYAKAEASSKLIAISETVRRRISEAEQKWYLYNVLSDTEVELPEAEPSKVEETIIMNDPQANEDGTKSGEDEECDFQTMGVAPTMFEQAVLPPRTKHKAFLSIFLSRVPVPELRTLCGSGTQTNETVIERLRRAKMGLP